MSSDASSAECTYWARSAGGDGDAAVAGHALATGAQASAGIFVTGSFTGTVQLGDISVTSHSAGSSRDGFVSKYADTDGNVEWVTQVGGSSGEVWVQAIAVPASPENGVYIAGRFSGSVTVGTKSLTSQAAGEGWEACLCHNRALA